MFRLNALPPPPYESVGLTQNIPCSMMALGPVQLVVLKSLHCFTYFAVVSL